MSDIFLSYIAEEQGIASSVRDFVQGFMTGKTVFMADRWTINAGENWLDTIKSELVQAKVVLSMMSPRSIKKPWIHFEAGAGWINKVIIPLCYGKRMSKERLPEPYSRFQAIELRHPSEQYDLIRSLYHHLGAGEAPRPEYLALRLVGKRESDHRRLHRDLTETVKQFEEQEPAPRLRAKAK